MRSVGNEVWQSAQQGVAFYWQKTKSDVKELSRILQEKIEAVDLACRAVSALKDCSGPKLEIGIGPIGVGVIHFMESDGPKIGLDPLPVVRLSNAMPFSIAVFVSECCKKAFHLQARGEDIPIAANSVSVVTCYNVLDHVQDPETILREALRVVKSGGFLLLGCDSVSLAGLLKFHAYTRWRHRHSLGVICHPFHFLAAQLERLVSECGFAIVWVHRRRRERMARMIGHAFRLLIVAQKP